MRRVLALAAVLAACGAPKAPAEPEAPKPQAGLPTETVTFPDGSAVRVDVARTPQEHATGLMYRESLPDDYGMLFVFPGEAAREFWMKNTFVSLDIVFIGSDRAVTVVHERVPRTYSTTPESEIPRAAGAARYVLELPAGQAAKRGVRAGTRLDFKEIPVPFILESPAFAPGGPIPARHTCDGEDVSPNLRWNGAPPAAKALVLKVDDPDAPGSEPWLHWLIYDLPVSAGGLAEGVPDRPGFDGGVGQSKNGFGRVGWGGPCPPPGRPHRYRFRLFALSRALEVGPGAGAARVEQAMRGKILGSAELWGSYKR